MLSALQLADELTGRVIVPGDPDYDQARTVVPGGFDRRPALIARVADASDVSRVVALAREAGLDLAVRSGGHSAAAHGVVDDGIVVDVSEMKGLAIEPEQRTAWAETGLTAGEYTAAVGAHGLATGLGDTGTVGIGGITLSGGVGFLVRKYGLTIDDLLAAEVVTADGEIRHVDAETHSDLFWALRGGGGNFGVATRFKFRLHELATILGGMLILPATPSVIASFVAELEAAPDELSAIANVMTAPPMPFLPSELHGRPILLGLLAYAGPPEDGERVTAPLRALATPLADMVRPMPYPELYAMEPEDPDYHPVYTARALLVEGIDEAAAETIVDRLESATATLAAVQLRVLGGAMARVPVDATAFAHRSSRMMVNVAAIHESLDDRPARRAWVSGLTSDLTRADTGAYVGFLGDEGPERVRAAYPGATWDRLKQVKARYDPDNLFRLNQNIPPASA
jgi:FAD/FMN-containing dehydrogenase